MKSIICNVTLLLKGGELLMKKNLISMFLILLGLFYLAGCAKNTMIDAVMTDKANESIKQMETGEASPNKENSENETSEQVLLEAISAYIDIPNGFDTYLLNNTSEQVLKEQNVTQAQINEYLNLAKKEVEILPCGDDIRNPSYAISVRSKEPKAPYNEIDNLLSLSESEIANFAESFVAEFGVNEYNILETPNALFIGFRWNPAGDEMRYLTLADKKLIYIFGNKQSGNLSEQDLVDLEQVATSFTLK